MSNRFNFTKKSIDAIPSPEKGKRAYCYDIKVNGLGLSITDKGTRSFIVYRKINGRPERIKLGRYPDMTIEQARRKATEVLAAIAQGENPNDSKRLKNNEPTFAVFFNEYMEKHARVHKKAWHHDQNQFRLHLSHWSKRKLSSFTKKDIQNLHSKLGKENGHYTANRVLSLLHILFNKAIEWGYIQMANPAHKIAKFKEKSRERFIQADELPRLFKSLSEEPNETIRDYIVLSLLTGARRANVQAMRWEEINLENQTWYIAETKSGKSQTIPLTKEATEILKIRQQNRASEWVFPGTGKTGHLVEPKTGWKRILKRAGLKDLRIHDLRRTLGSWQAATGANLSIIGRTLNHSNVNTTAIYARLNLDPIRNSMETATQAMLEAGKLIEKSEETEESTL